jgi:hypothetical protein
MESAYGECVWRVRMESGMESAGYMTPDRAICFFSFIIVLHEDW